MKSSRDGVSHLELVLLFPPPPTCLLIGVLGDIRFLIVSGRKKLKDVGGGIGSLREAGRKG